MRNSSKGLDVQETLNNVLVHLFNEIWKLEEKLIITEEFKDITNKDMHVIEAIGMGTGNKMSEVAAKLDVKICTLTISINGLVKKGYVERNRSELDRRVVFITLTEKGKKAYAHHAKYHKQMTETILEKISPDEIPVLMNLLDGLEEFFYGYSTTNDTK